MSVNLNFLKVALAWFGGIFHKADDELKALVPIATGVVEILKGFINSPVADLLAALTGTSALEASLKIIIPKVLIELQLIQGINDSSTDVDVNAAIKKFVDSLPSLSDDARERIYTSIAALILKLLHQDGKITFGQASAIVEMYFETSVQLPAAA